MKLLRINGYTVTIEGTWFEVSNGNTVLWSGSCSIAMKPMILWKIFEERGIIQ